MINFETKFFQKMKFNSEQLKQYFESAERDYGIAATEDVPEVQFKFAYDSLIKIGLTLIAKAGYKVRSQPGHHIKIIEKLSELLEDEDIDTMANTMRQNRNKDLYDGGFIVTAKEAKECVNFTAEVIDRARKALLQNKVNKFV